MVKAHLTVSLSFIFSGLLLCDWRILLHNWWVLNQCCECSHILGAEPVQPWPNKIASGRPPAVDD
jgi:hypothetical protein